MSRPAARFVLLVALLTGCEPVDAAPVVDAGLVADGGVTVDPPDAAAPACAPADGSGVPSAAAALDEIEAGRVALTPAWRFRLDSGDAGVGGGWFTRDFDDSGWATIDGGRTWQEQGYAGPDTIAWYRKHVAIPASWSGSVVHLDAAGVDDEYDLYVNGTFVAHYGSRPDQSMYQRLTEARIESLLVAGQDNVIALRVLDWGGGGGIVKPIWLRRRVPLEPWRDLLPAPIVDTQPDWVELYWAAWQLAFDHIAFGTPANGFAAAYMDPAFDGNIYQWDSSFMALFGRYGLALFPVMATLDNFYGKQRADGYIQRVYSGATGAEVGTPSADEPMVNPPLFAWVEWRYYRFSGDASRLSRVLPILERYYTWLKNNVGSSTAPGLYYQTGLGSGMDNTPRGDIGGAGWGDMSMQQVLAATMLANLAGALGLADRQTQWTAEATALAATINARLWNDHDGIYYDLTRAGTYAGVRHIGAFWALLSGVADADKAARLVAHLQDPAEFHRDHLFPSLAASDPGYVAAGNYWRGSVWAPTDYMVVKGLDQTGHDALAREAAANHIAHLAAVYAQPPTDASKIAPEQRGGDYRTIWECYSAEAARPATRWDDTYYSRQDFVGWSGLGPIALLIEDVLGFDVDGVAGKVVWTMTRTDRHGVERLPVGMHNRVSLVAAARASAAGPATVSVRAEAPFTLEVRRPGQSPVVRAVDAGCSVVEVP
ncbi:MAG: MGH1-like glycoside hydrolase domain-containing protein [Polyangia bacterium]